MTSGTLVGPITISDTTDSTTKDTGALILEGGLGVEKDVTVGAAVSIGDRLFVKGESEFIGIVTFRGGTVRLGDSVTDDIVVGGEFASSLVPDDDDTFDLGSATQQWRHLYLDGTLEADAINNSGVTTTTALKGTSYLQAPHSATTQNFTVTVATKDSSHRYNGSGSSNGYKIDGVFAPILHLTPGKTYRFTNDNTGSHPLKFYLDVDKVYNYTTGVSFQNSYTEITISDTTPAVLHYQCTAHAKMGNSIITHSNAVNTPHDATFEGLLNAKGNVDLGNATTDTITATGRFDSDLLPSTDGARDLGSSTNEWQDLFIDGTAQIDSLVADTADINGGTIDGVTIGGASAGAGTFTDLTGGNIQIGVTGDNEIDTTSGGLTIDSAGGTVTVDDNLTVNGTFTVLGTQSIINTETLKVEDSLIEVGLVNSGGSLVAPSSDANIDVGLLFHYYSGSAKKAAVFWDDSVGRIAFGADVSESSSVLTNTTHATIEAGGVFIKDAAGLSAVISHDGSLRQLENITVDGGSF
jgi:plastocyanin